MDLIIILGFFFGLLWAGREIVRAIKNWWQR
jgi:hypothetical protein